MFVVSLFIFLAAVHKLFHQNPKAHYLNWPILRPFNMFFNVVPVRLAIIIHWAI